MEKNHVFVDADQSNTRKRRLILSALPHTWLIDIDGTLVVHNGYLSEGSDIPLENSIAFLHSIPEEDCVILLTSRAEKYREQTERFLEINGVRYNRIIFDLPVGERLLINDDKPSGLCMTYAIALSRNEGINCIVEINEKL